MMSPATSAVTGGNSHTDANSSKTSGIARPDSRTYFPNATSLGEPLWSASAVTKMIGTATAAPSPRYVRFCDQSLRISQRYAVQNVGIRPPAPAAAHVRAHADSSAAERDHELLDDRLLGAEAKLPVGGADVAEREALRHPPGRLEIRHTQPVPAAHRALQVSDRPLVQDPALVDDGDAVAELLDV